ncbi:MAG: hypothetical protein V3U65_02300 [Granulosicoccaceae bacterium]
MNHLRSLISLIPFIALSIISCDTEKATTPDPEPEPIPTFESCLAASIADPISDISFTLPANFVAGGSLRIDQVPTSAIEFFDESTGELRLQSTLSRLPQTIEYSVLDAEAEVIETREHNLVFPELRVMPLGDSITNGVEFFDGTDSPEIGLRIGYRLALYNQLTAAGLDFDFIGQAGQRAGQDAGLPDPDNNGYPGVDIDFIVDKLPEILRQNPADVVLLHIGTNQTPSTAEGIDDILDRIESLSADAQTIMVLVATLVPKRDVVQQQQVAAFNLDLRQRIKNRSNSNVIIVEQAQALTDADISTEMIGIHPNDMGYLKMANTWFAALDTSSIVQSCAQ